MDRRTEQPDHAPRWLLVSDIDDTLTGDDAALARLVRALARRRDRLRVALNSSRPAASVDNTLAQHFPPGFEPDAIITAMGTEIRVAGKPLPTWTRRFDPWPRDAIDQLVRSLGHRPHDAAYQTAHKASYAVPRGAAQQQVAAELDRRGLPCRLVASGTDDLDILPPGAGKDHATLFLAGHLGIDPQHTVVAGDSANDLAMFRIAPHAIAVGNARAELLEAMPADRAYHASASHAAGVHEGLVQLGLLEDDLIEEA